MRPAAGSRLNIQLLLSSFLLRFEGCAPYRQMSDPIGLLCYELCYEANWPPKNHRYHCDLSLRADHLTRLEIDKDIKLRAVLLGNYLNDINVAPELFLYRE